MYLSVYKLPQAEALRIGLDTYRVHQVLCSLFEKATQNGRLLYADKGYICCHRAIIIQSPKKPGQLPACGVIFTQRLPDGYFSKDDYSFEITLNPVRRLKSSGKIEALQTPAQIADWFCGKASLLGFEIADILVDKIWTDRFIKKASYVTIRKAKIIGRLKVINRASFIKAAQCGIGKARAFGCGLLQLNPAREEIK